MMRRINAGRTRSVRFGLLITAAFAGFSPALTASTAAFALSDLREIPGARQAENPSSDDADGDGDEPITNEPLQLPMPDPLVNKSLTGTNDGDVDGDQKNDAPETDASVEILSDISKVPEPVRRLREMIVEAAASGDMERLRPLLGKGPTETQVSQVETDEDAVATLKGLSGDPAGIEILAILLDVLSTGFARVGAGTPEEIYVWPYFAEKPLSSLTPPEKVDLFRLVTAGDFSEMEEFGSYNFYKVGITPDGQWKFFIAGD